MLIVGAGIEAPQREQRKGWLLLQNTDELTLKLICKLKIAGFNRLEMRFWSDADGRINEQTKSTNKQPNDQTTKQTNKLEPPNSQRTADTSR